MKEKPIILSYAEKPQRTADDLVGRILVAIVCTIMILIGTLFFVMGTLTLIVPLIAPTRGYRDPIAVCLMLAILGLFFIVGGMRWLVHRFRRPATHREAMMQASGDPHRAANNS